MGGLIPILILDLRYERLIPILILGLRHGGAYTHPIIIMPIVALLIFLLAFLPVRKIEKLPDSLHYVVPDPRLIYCKFIWQIYQHWCEITLNAAD